MSLFLQRGSSSVTVTINTNREANTPGQEKKTLSSDHHRMEQSVVRRRPACVCVYVCVCVCLSHLTRTAVILSMKQFTPFVECIVSMYIYRRGSPRSLVSLVSVKF